MEFRQIEHFLELFELRNMTKASRELFISQQGLSRSIKNLENELNLSLFHKSQRGAFPTPEAEYLKPYFETLLQNKKLLLTQADQLRCSLNAQHIHIVCASHHLYHDAFLKLKNFESLYPSVKLIFHEKKAAEAIKNLQSGECFFAILDETVSFDVNYLGVFSEEAYSAVISSSHPLCKVSQFTWSMAEDQIIAIADESSSFNRIIHSFLSDNHIHPKGFYQPDQMADIFPGIVQNQAIGIVLPSVFHYLNPNLFKTLPISPDLNHRSWIVSNKNHTFNSYEKKLMDYIQHHFS